MGDQAPDDLQGTHRQQAHTVAVGTFVRCLECRSVRRSRRVVGYRFDRKTVVTGAGDHVELVRWRVLFCQKPAHAIADHPATMGLPPELLGRGSAWGIIPSQAEMFSRDEWAKYLRSVQLFLRRTMEEINTQ